MPNGLNYRAENNILLSDFLGSDAADLDVFGPAQDKVIDTPPRGSDFDVFTYQWNEATESFESTS